MADRTAESPISADGGPAARWRISGIILLAVVVYLVGNRTVALWDRDEPRNAMTSRNMLRSGDWVVPRLYDETRTAKPPLAYWCQASVMAVVGENTFSARLPSAVAMVATLGVFGSAAWRMTGPRRAAWAVLVLASNALVLICAKASTTDALLLVWVTAAQLCGYAIWRGGGRWWVWLVMGATVGMAGLTKGPVVLGVMGMTWIAVWLLGLTLPSNGREAPATGFEVVVARQPDHRPEPPANNAGRIRRSDGRVASVSRSPPGASRSTTGRGARVAQVFVALLVVAAVVTPWLYLVQERSPGWVGTSVSHDVVRRMAQPLEGHKGPPGYHLAAIWLFLLPWSLLLPMAVSLAWKRRHLPQLRFALGAALGPWVMFELVRTKLPHYMLPTYPWLALLAGDAIVRCLRGQHKDLAGTPFLATLAIVAALAGLASLGPGVVSWRFGDSVMPGAVFAAAALAWLATVVSLFFRRRTAWGLAALGLGAMATWAVAWAVYLPQAHFLRVSVRAADVLRREGATGPGRALMLDYKEPSLGFYQGGTIREHPGTRLTAEHLAGGTPWIVITAAVWDKTAPEIREQFEVVERIKGFAYAGGRVVEVMIVRSREASPSG